MRTVHKTFLLAGVAAALLGLEGSVFSPWSNDPTVNTPICTAPNSHVAVNMNVLPGGIYAYRITAGAFTGMRKMILLK